MDDVSSEQQNMELIIDLLPPIITGGALAFIAWFLAREKTSAEVRLVDAQMITAMSDNAEQLQRQVNQLSNELMQMRIAHRKEIDELKRQYEADTELLLTAMATYQTETDAGIRVLIGQLEDAGITPKWTPSISPRFRGDDDLDKIRELLKGENNG